MVACDGPYCSIEWFHYECVGLQEHPKSDKWFCTDCSQNAVSSDDDAKIVKISKAVEVQVSGALPNDSVRFVVMNVCSKWSGIDVCIVGLSDLMYVIKLMEMGIVYSGHFQRS